MLRGQCAAQQPMLAQSLKGVAFTTVGAQYLCMHVVVVGTPGRSTTLNMGWCQVKTGGLVNDTTPELRGEPRSVLFRVTRSRDICKHYWVAKHP